MREQTVRDTARRAGVPLWMLAEALNMTDSTLSRKFRHEWTQAERERALKIIGEIKEAMERDAGKVG